MANLTPIRRSSTASAQPGGRRGERVAVLLNANARAVNEKLRREIGRFVPAEDVYFSRSLDEAREIAEQVLDRGYSTLLTGGGDGTFVGFVNEVFNAIGNERDTVVSAGGAARKLAPQRRLPRFGVLHLGTGNSLGNLTGASKGRVGVVEDILRARSGDVTQTRQLNLLRVDNKFAPFAGMGLDAKVLNDFVAVKNRCHGTPFQKMAGGGLGYIAAVTGMSIPYYMTEKGAANVTVINEGAPAYQLGPDGKPIGKAIGTGEIIYRGGCRMASAGTVPCYGYEFTIFPHALRYPGRMHLRLTAMRVPEILRHLPEIWKGRTPTSSLLDFQAERVRMKFDRVMPVQIGGDAEGYRDEMHLSVAPHTVEMLDFKAHA